MSLAEQLASVLPKDHKFKLVYVQSEPKQCNNLILYNSHQSTTEKPQLTLKIKHFLLVVSHDDLILFGIEVYNYFSVGDVNCQYLFVSKVDTTGLVSTKINANKLINKFLLYLISLKHEKLTYRLKVAPESTLKKINKLIQTQEPQSKTVELSDKFKVKLSLFTKSSNQYFFPESSKNPYKHLIDGDRLLKWWMNLVNDTLDASGHKFTKKIMIPGSLNPTPYLLPGWEIGSVFGDLQKAVFNIPNFPDDPKTRFLEFLVVENRTNLTLKQFYDELGFRQEFRLGNVVGIIGCELPVFTQLSNSGSQTSSVQSDLQPFVLANKQYKRLIKVIKSEDFQIADDIRLLVSTKLPFFLRLHHKHFDYTELEGKYEHNKVATAGSLQVNNLTGLVRRKK